MRKWLVAAGVMTALGAAGAPAASAAGTCSLSPTNGTVTRTLGDRSYRLDVPAGLTATKVPLLLSLHGFGSTGDQDATFTGWTTFAATHGFIVAYPQGHGSQFSGAWDPYTTSSTDVAFEKAVAADVASSYCVDPQRQYVDGWSNGAVMSQRTACDAAGTFASVSSYAGGSPVQGGVSAPCTPSRPIAVAMTVGQEDFTYPGLATDAQEWRDRDGCAAAATHTADAYGASDTYACAAGTDVVSRVIANTSHNWPSGAAGEDQRSRLWAFFSAHPRP